MSQHSPYQKPTRQTRYARKDQLPSMATPRQPKPPKKSGFLGLIFVLAIISGVSWLVMLIFGFGPYKRETISPRSTPTQMTLVSIDSTLIGTGTPVPIMGLTVTPTNLPTATITRSPTPEKYPFILYGEPEAMTSDLIRPTLGCGYLVIAGQVWDLQGEPYTDSIRVHLFGELGGFEIDAYSEPGSAIVYGESGYEFVLQGLVVDSLYSLKIQLEDGGGQYLSQAYDVQTYEDCLRNLILINFKNVR